MSFLKAQWKNLAIFNYEVNSTLLKNYLPHGTEIDLWKDKCYVSLVGFMFQNTTILGCHIPFHINFEEVNLRFYVKSKSRNELRRGVVFIKEIVPRRAIALVANLFYKERYEAMAMKHLWQRDSENLQVEYGWRYENEWQLLSVNAKAEPDKIIDGSEEGFITEHYYGYTKVSPIITYEYEVKHPIWKTYSIKNFEVKVDFGKVYGNDFRELTDMRPSSVILADGSEISVENKRTLICQ
jgi:uncharacterized protein